MYTENQIENVNFAVLSNGKIVRIYCAINVKDADKYTDSVVRYNEIFTYLGIGKYHSHNGNLVNDNQEYHFWAK